MSKVHNGYFSQDKKGRLKDTKGDTQADDDTYNTIMRDKEWLLSLSVRCGLFSPTRRCGKAGTTPTCFRSAP